MHPMRRKLSACWGRHCRMPCLSLGLLACAGLAVGQSGNENSVAAGRGDTVRGQQLLARYHCGTCHTIPGVPASRSNFAASLEGFGRRSYIAGRVANSRANLVRWLVKPQSIVPETLMPDLGVSVTDAADMVSYLRQLR